MTIAVLPILTVLLDKWFAEGFLSPLVFQFTPSSAQTILSTIATGAMAALSLAYSLALLVFTLAAGNIGPRLLKRFTTEPINQITAGILGGTFLYSLHALLYIQEDFLPKLTISGAGLLAIISVLQLIYFVRQVAKNITIDEEIAEITSNLIEDLEKQTAQKEHETPEVPNDEEFKFEFKAQTAGYINNYNIIALIKIAQEKDFTIKLKAPDGKFVLTDEVIAQIDKKIDDDVENEINKAITIEATRSNNNLIEFSMRLLVEIALRALSPGVNDTYTAIAVVDSLSKAISVISEKQTGHAIHLDGIGDPRIFSIHRSLKEVIGIAFHPLRRASTNNILMAQSLAKVYSRLYLNGKDTTKEILKAHAKLLIKEISNGNHLDTDINSVIEFLTGDLKNIAKAEANT